ncbi:MAG: asparagine synthase (glutamine-hydrolyzing) [Candidatus Zixiibacteriota bacterium]|nr:MAG: asparagine synthase (glutamine-hydrolyzing) [candidate division Zixibacteria bacterium]
MCGIAGYFELGSPTPPDKDLVRRMVGSIRHRGPDEFGAFFDNRCALGHARLSIIDLAGGSQPLSNEDGSLWITYNGEIYNYLELRKELEASHHYFRTRSDTEVIVHAFEEWGAKCLDRFNGQFAFAIYDSRDGSLFLARDRLGIRPLFYTQHGGRFYFGSEIKALFAEPSILRQIDLKGLDETFTWWTTAPPRTAFMGINELPAASYLKIQNGKYNTKSYWDLEYPETYNRQRSAASWAEELHELLVDSVRLRLRADVPVGAYLSGGLDSSATTSLIRHFTDTRVETFSIAFHDKAYDESKYQQQMSDYLGTRHHQIKCSYRDIAEVFPAVIRHAERPILRTAPAPLYLLSKLVRDHEFKVVLTGEGSDEMLGGYDIFKETLIRRFWARNPDSAWRPLLLKRLYPTLPLSAARARFYLETFYKAGLEQIDEFHFSHIPRINTTSKVKDYFTKDVQAELTDYDPLKAFKRDLPNQFYSWHHLARAQYLEAKSLLAGYILSSQGDRMGSAHAVEGRFPFLDHRIAEFATTVPPLYKIHGLNEKFVLKKAMARELPPEITKRVKQPYMAPDSNSFVQEDSPQYVSEMLSEESLVKTGLFNPLFVQKLRDKCSRLSHAHLSFKDNMSFLGVLSTQLLVDQFINNPPEVNIIDRKKFKVWHDQSIEAAEQHRG